MNKPTIKKYIVATAAKDDPFILEIRNFLPDDADAMMWIEDLREFGIITDSPSDLELNTNISRLKMFGSMRGGELGSLIQDKVSELESMRDEAGFKRYMLIVKQSYDAEEVRLYIESFRQDEL